MEWFLNWVLKIWYYARITYMSHVFTWHSYQQKSTFQLQHSPDTKNVFVSETLDVKQCDKRQELDSEITTRTKNKRNEKIKTWNGEIFLHKEFSLKAYRAWSLYQICTLYHIIFIILSSPNLTQTSCFAPIIFAHHM